MEVFAVIGLHGGILWGVFSTQERADVRLEKLTRIGEPAIIARATINTPPKL